MLKKLGFLVVILALAQMFFASMAGAETTYRKKTVIDFDDVLLEGTLKKPTGAYITERRELSFKTLIRTRKNFEQEMFRSVDVLK
jgi:hypothetical protein